MVLNRRQKTQLFYQIIRGALNPEDVSYSLKVGDILRGAGLFSLSVEKIKSQPGGEDLFRNRSLAFTHDLQFYKACPPGSLGREFYDHLTENDLDPNALDPIPVISDDSYLENLIRQVHDIWHVVTGFDTSVAGEIGLQVFKAKQLNSPFSLVAIGGACFITLLKNPQFIENFIDHMGRGYQIARQMKPLILVDWNLYWHKSADLDNGNQWIREQILSISIEQLESNQ